MKPFILFLLTFMLNQISDVSAQDFEFGDVTIEALEESRDPIFKDAPAKYSFLKIYFEYGQVFKVHERIKIYNKEGLEYADIEIPFEDIKSIKAVTYNLENGKIVSTDVSKRTHIFKEKVEEDDVKTKISFPNVRVGSIIELSYLIRDMGTSTINSQYSIPVDYFELDLRNPTFLDLNIVENKFSNVKLEVTEKNRELLFKGRKIPPITDLSYIANSNNYRGRIHLETAREYGMDKLKTWEQVAAFFEKMYIKSAIWQHQDFFQKELQIAIGQETDPLMKAKRIFRYVQEHFEWNETYGVIPRRTDYVFRDKSGGVDDINLLLVQMLRSQGFEANPFLIASKHKGFIYYPTIIGFNNVVAHVMIHNKPYLLDATRKFAEFGQLPLFFVNGDGLLVKKGGYELISTQVQEPSTISSIINAEVIPGSFQIKGNLKSKVTGYYARNFREQYEHAAPDEFEKDLEEEENHHLDVQNVVSENKLENDAPIMHHYDFLMNEYLTGIDDKIYFEPLLFLGQANDYFKEDARQFPIEFNIPHTKTYIINYNLPEGYRVESIPESKQLKIEDDMASLSFKITERGNTIQVLYKLSINKGIVPAYYYQGIQALFSENLNISKSKIVLTRINP